MAGWRWPGLRRWAWLASTEQIAVYHLTRAAKVAKELLGEDFNGVLVSDWSGMRRVRSGTGIHSRTPGWGLSSLLCPFAAYPRGQRGRRAEWPSRTTSNARRRHSSGQSRHPKARRRHTNARRGRMSEAPTATWSTLCSSITTALSERRRKNGTTPKRLGRPPTPTVASDRPARGAVDGGGGNQCVCGRQSTA